MPKQLRLVLLFLCIAASTRSQAQNPDSANLYSKIYSSPDKLFNFLDKKSSLIDGAISRKTEKYLKRLEKQEKKLYRKIRRIDSSKASTLFPNIAGRYTQLKDKISSPGKGDETLFLSHSDSIKTVLNFIQDNNLLKVSNQNLQLEKVLSQYSGSINKISRASDVAKLIKEREIFLKTELSNLGFHKEIHRLKKTVYYYRAQVDEYKQVFENSSRLEAKLLEVVNKIPAFRKFFAERSELAFLFKVPGESSMPHSTSGLQTVAAIDELIQGRIASAGSNGNDLINQSISEGNARFRQLKEKVIKMGGSDSEFEMPDFKPNSQKTKSFLKRIELGTDFQSNKPNGIFPVTTDIGITIGFKINDNSTIGIGASHKVGWGDSFRKIQISHQGFGLRAYVDVRLKGKIFLGGGFEQNYQAEIRRIRDLYNQKAWQQSALLGVSKKYSIGKKRKGELKILFDFLYNRHIPQTKPILFRVGYGL